MSFIAATDLFAALRSQRLLTPAQSAELTSAVLATFPDARTLAKHLLERGWLTAYQINQLFQGKGPSLVLGSYVLLEKLGEGGMGTVYKARNWKLDKIVALKVIKAERLANPVVLKRFQREIRSAAQLNHPNIVRAFDADEVNGTHFFVMEFVEGTDLSALVKKNGPLPVAQACDFLRQAAQGLQHAHERGMVHRDIKPHNLLVTSDQGRVTSKDPRPLVTGHSSLVTVKILDMGLALADTAKDDGHSTTMTQEGMVMGTPDYIAPEQSLNAHDVDIRADLYSLGCTLYFLLSGKAPFAGGSLAERLLKHQLQEPAPIEKFRPDVPPAVGHVLRKLLAKKPQERYQTPAELALALEQTRLNPQQSIPGSRTEQGTDLPPAEVLRPVPDLSHEGASFSATLPMLQNLRAEEERRRRQTQWWLVGGIGVVGSLALIFLIVKVIVPLVSSGDRPALPIPVVKSKEKEKPDPIIVPPKVDPNEKIAFGPGPATDEWVKAVQALKVEDQARAVFAKLKELNEGFDLKHKDNIWADKDEKIVKFQVMQPLTDVSPLRALKDLEHLDCRSDFYYRPCPNISLADLSPLKDLPLKHLNLQSQRIEDLTPLANMKLEFLGLDQTRARDVSIVKKMPSLRTLHLGFTPITHLEDLRGLKQLRVLGLAGTGVKDLQALADLTLETLYLNGTPVVSLLPLNMDLLRHLELISCPIADLSPLAQAKNLRVLYLEGLPEVSLEPLKNLKLEHLTMGYDPRHANFIRSLALKTFNRQDMADFWTIVDLDPEQEQWRRRVADLPPSELMQEVSLRLGKFNPTGGAQPKFKEEAGTIVEADLGGFRYKDLRPLAALGKLRSLKIGHTDGALRNLEPLRGLPLKTFHVAQLGHLDLSPLAGMPLEELRVFTHGATTHDFSPIQSMKSLRALHVNIARVLDLRPVTQAPALAQVHIHSDHAPPDLSGLKNLKQLEAVTVAYDDPRHRDALRSLKLKTINGKAPDDFWKDIAEQQAEFVRRELVRLNGPDTKVATSFEQGDVVNLDVRVKQAINLAPVRGFAKLRSLIVVGADPAKPINLSPLRGLSLKHLRLAGVKVEDLSPLKSMALDSLSIEDATVTDLSSLRGATVRSLLVWNCLMFTDLPSVKDIAFETIELKGTGVKDLSPLRGMPLKYLHVGNSLVADLSPVANMPLEQIVLFALPVHDLTPLRTVKTLKTLNLDLPLVKDLRPIQDLPIGFLEMGKTSPADLTPLLKLPLKHIKSLEFEPFRGDAEVLRAIPTLETINGKNAKDLLKAADDTMAAFQKWRDDVVKLPAKEQAQAVIDELKKRNPAFVGEMASEIEQDQVIGFSTPTTVDLRDIAPLRAFPSLRRVNLGFAPKGTLTSLYPLRGLSLERCVVFSETLTDLSPLTDMKTLVTLTIGSTSLSDLGPLKNLTLTEFHCGSSKVADLSPLGGMKLSILAVQATRISDLSPLRGMPLKYLHIGSNAVRDISPLKGMPLDHLYVNGCNVNDHRVLQEMPLKNLYLDFVPWRDSAILRSIKNLETVNQKPAKESHAWADWEDAVRAVPLAQQVEMVKAKLVELNGKDADVGNFKATLGKAKGVDVDCPKPLKDISPLRAFSDIHALRIGTTNSKVPKDALADLSPLRGLSLKTLSLYSTAVSDLTPLAGMPLEKLWLHICPVKDLSPLKGAPLKELGCYFTELANFESLPVTTLELLQIARMKSLVGLEKQPLKRLSSYQSSIISLEPVANCPLEYLGFSFSSTIADLTPVQRMTRLKTFHWAEGGCRDLGPLRGLALETVYLPPHIHDLTPLTGMPIKTLSCAFNVWRDEEVLKSLTKLEKFSVQGVSPTIGGPSNPGPFLPAAEFRQKLPKEKAEFDKRVADIRKQPVEQHPALVEKWLVEANKGVDVTLLNPKYKDGKLIYVHAQSNNLVDCSPLRALQDLETLDIGPFRGSRCYLVDIWPLRGMKIRQLNMAGTNIYDLRPLEGMPLQSLIIIATPVTDLRPLRDSQLEAIALDYVPERDAPILRQIKTLQKINGKDKSEVLK